MSNGKTEKNCFNIMVTFFSFFFSLSAVYLVIMSSINIYKYIPYYIFIYKYMKKNCEINIFYVILKTCTLSLRKKNEYKLTNTNILNYF